MSGSIHWGDLLREQEERLKYWTPERIAAQRAEWEQLGAEAQAHPERLDEITAKALRLRRQRERVFDDDVMEA